MPIEFRCSHCQKLLSTPEGSAGKQAKCPSCGAVVPIPLRSEVELAETSWHPTGSGGAPSGAFHAQAHLEIGASSTAAALPADLVPTQLELGDVLTRSWEIFKQCWQPCLVATWGNIALSAGAVGLSFVPWLVRDTPDPGPADIVLFCVAALVCACLHLGLLRIMIKLARGERVAASDMFSATDVLLPALIAGVLYCVACGVGFAFCFVPGFYVLLAGSQFLQLLVDRRCGALESLRLSWQITAGNKVTLFLLGILLWAISTAASTVTLGLSTIVVSPFWFLAMAVAYVMMTGQRTAYLPPAMADRPLAPQPQFGASA
jgi:phage FluMu protein Com